MDIGMLWYDDGPNSINDRVTRAASYYTEKYGREPNLCFVNPEMLEAEEGNAKGIVIRKDKGIMPGHFWIGVDESQIKKNGTDKKPSKGASKAKPKTADSEKSETAKKTKTKAIAKSTAKVTAAAGAKSKAAKKSKPKAIAKSAAAAAAKTTATAKKKVAKKSKAAKAKAVAAKAKADIAKPKKRKPAVLKKKSGSRVEAGSKPKAKAKA